MHRAPGEDLDLSTVLEERQHTLGPGRYESLHLVGELEGQPMLTFTSPETADVEHRPPSEPYLAMVAQACARPTTTPTTSSPTTSTSARE